MPVIRVLRTAKVTLSKTFYLDEVGTPATGAVAVSVTRIDGTVVESGVASGPDGSGAYSYTFGGRDVVDELDVTWSATVGGDAVVLSSDVIEVVGNFFFGLAEGRDVDSALSNTTRFPTSLLIEKRIEVEDECERICGQAFVPRFARAVLSGGPRSVLALPGVVSGRTRPALALPHTMIRAIRSVTVSSQAYTAGQLAGISASDTGMIYNLSGWPLGVRNIVVEYEHGRDRPPPDISRVSKIRFKSMVMQSQSGVSDRAERVVTVDAQGGSVVYGSPGVDRTGIPEVDAAYGRFPSPRPGFG